MLDFFIFEQISFITPMLMIVIVSMLYIIQVYVQYKIFKSKNTLSHGYPVNTFVMFAPIYEEIIFRGILFFGLIPLFGVIGSGIINALFFGLWHIRSIFFMTSKKVIFQVVYTTLFIAPSCLYATYITGNIWLAVIIHYINNILAPVCDEWKIFEKK